MGRCRRKSGDCAASEDAEENPAIVPQVNGEEPYLSFDMVQPSHSGHVFNPDTKRCIHCNCDEDDAFVGGEPCINEAVELD